MKHLVHKLALLLLSFIADLIKAEGGQQLG